MDWTTYFARGRPERALSGVVLDSESLDGIDIGAERTRPVRSGSVEVDGTRPDGAR